MPVAPCGMSVQAPPSSEGMVQRPGVTWPIWETEAPAQTRVPAHCVLITLNDFRSEPHAPPAATCVAHIDCIAPGSQ